MQGIVHIVYIGRSVPDQSFLWLPAIGGNSDIFFPSSASTAPCRSLFCDNRTEHMRDA